MDIELKILNIVLKLELLNKKIDKINEILKELLNLQEEINLSLDKLENDKRVENIKTLIEIEDSLDTVLCKKELMFETKNELEYKLKCLKEKLELYKR